MVIVAPWSAVPLAGSGDHRPLGWGRLGGRDDLDVEASGTQGPVSGSLGQAITLGTSLGPRETKSVTVVPSPTC
jgi:hypothetical protein